MKHNEVIMDSILPNNEEPFTV